MSHTQKNKSLEKALEYLACGYSLVPVSKDKKPLVAWGEFMKRRASKEEIESWFSSGNNMAVVTGEVSGGLYAIDFDTVEIFEKWLELPGVRETVEHLVIEKSGRGAHVFFKSERVFYCQKLAYLPSDDHQSGRMAAIETRGNNGYIIVDPSIHSNGKPYQVINGDLKNVPLIELKTIEFLLNSARSLSMDVDPTPIRSYASKQIKKEELRAPDLTITIDLRPVLRTFAVIGLLILVILI